MKRAAPECESKESKRKKTVPTLIDDNFPPLKALDPNILKPDDFSVDRVLEGQASGRFYYVVGGSGVGKSTVVKWILSHFHEMYPNVLVMTRTSFNGFYQQFVPPGRVKEGWDVDAMESLFEGQEKLIKLIQKYPQWARTQNELSTHTVMIVDDVMGSANVRQDKLATQLTTIGRHWWLTTFFLVQDITGLTTHQRENANGVIFFHQNRRGVEVLCDTFCGWLGKPGDKRGHGGCQAMMDHYIGGGRNDPTRNFIVQLRDPNRSGINSCFVGSVPTDEDGNPVIPEFKLGAESLWTGEYDGEALAAEPSTEDVSITEATTLDRTVEEETPPEVEESSFGAWCRSAVGTVTGRVAACRKFV